MTLERPQGAARRQQHDDRRHTVHGHGVAGQRRQRGHGWWLAGRGQQGFEPWGHQNRFFAAGEVRLALLSLLEQEPTHGYELMRRMEERSGGLYRASAGAVYPNLQQLEDEQLVRSSEEGGRRVYTLTDEGRSELRRQDAAVRRIWSRADAWGGWAGADGPGSDEVMGPVMRLVRAALRGAGQPSYDSERVERIREVLRRAADEIEQVG